MYASASVVPVDSSIISHDREDGEVFSQVTMDHILCAPAYQPFDVVPLDKSFRRRLAVRSQADEDDPTIVKIPIDLDQIGSHVVARRSPVGKHIEDYNLPRKVGP